jgi:predicted nucleic acid-binding protein
MIVVDSSVWIAQLRGVQTAAVARLETLVDSDDILVGDLVFLELLQGARDDAHAARIARSLRRFPIVPMSSEALAVEPRASIAC